MFEGLAGVPAPSGIFSPLFMFRTRVYMLGALRRVGAELEKDSRIINYIDFSNKPY
jgi:hypothetical protein